MESSPANDTSQVEFFLTASRAIDSSLPITGSPIKVKETMFLYSRFVEGITIHCKDYRQQRIWPTAGSPFLVLIYHKRYKNFISSKKLFGKKRSKKASTQSYFQKVIISLKVEQKVDLCSQPFSKIFGSKVALNLGLY